jgi:biotin carboxyl carrier protein
MRPRARNYDTGLLGKPRDTWTVAIGESRRRVKVSGEDDIAIELLDEGRTLDLTAIDWRPGKPVFKGVLDGKAFTVQATPAAEGFTVRHRAAKARVLVLTRRSAELHDKLPEKQAADTSKLVLSPMPGLVVSMDVVTGQQVREGEVVCVLEAMKMQNIIRAERDGVVKAVNAKGGDPAWPPTRCWWSSPKLAFKAASASSMVTGRPRSTRLVTPCSSGRRARCREVGQVRLDVQADAVERHPAAQLHPDGGDLVLARPADSLALDPDADAAVADLALDVEGGQGADDPGLQRRDEGAHVAPRAGQVEHHIGHPLAGAVIGELAAAAAGEHRQAARVEQVFRLGRDAGGVERRVLQQPDQLARLARRRWPWPAPPWPPRPRGRDLAGRNRPADRAPSAAMAGRFSAGLTCGQA